jgi:hypothetical protein
MKKTFFIGLLDKDDKQQHWNEVEAFKIIEKLVCDYFGGGTIYQSRGVYKHEDGTIISEPSIVVMTSTEKQHGEFVSTIKTFFNQESIGVEIQKIELSFE